MRALSLVPTVTQRTYRTQNADTIIIIKDGKAIDSMTPEEMLQNAKAMEQVARRAIETRPKVAEQLAYDSAILLRKGVNFGLTSNPKILEMARVEAESNRDLRRYLPGGIKGEEQFGRPGVRNVDVKVAKK